MSSNSEESSNRSSVEPAKSSDQEDLKIKNVLQDVNELKGIIDDLKNSSKDTISETSQSGDRATGRSDLGSSDFGGTTTSTTPSNMNSMNIIMNRTINETLHRQTKSNKPAKVSQSAKERQRKSLIDHESNAESSESVQHQSHLTNDLEMFVQGSDRADSHSGHSVGIQQANSIQSDPDNDNDFELISSDLENNLHLDSNFDSNTLESNVSSNLDSNLSGSLSSNLSSANFQSTSTIGCSNPTAHDLPHEQTAFRQANQAEPLSKSNSQNLSQTTKDLQRGNKLKLFHHKSTEQVDQRHKQTWQKQLLQTPFFKSFNTQQLLAHYGNHAQQSAPELPDKIAVNLDDDPDEPLLSGSGQVSKECSDELIQMWSAILVKWKKPNQRPPGLKEIIRFGIPQTLRGQVWQLLVEGDDDHALIDTYRVLITKESAFEVNIQRDINRTFPANDYFKNTGSLGQDNLYKLCKAYSIFDEEIGYVQGLTFIGAALLLHMPEEQAFVILVRIMHDYGVRSLFRSGFEDLHLRFYQLDRLMEEQLPELYQHFIKLGVETHMWCSHWFLTLFTAKFPLHLVFYILDLFLYNKFNTIFQVSIALLSISQADLLKLDFEGVLKYFRVYLPKKYGTDANAKFLLKTAFNVKLKRLDKYEKDYAQFKEAKQDPVQRLTKENQRLQSSVLRLEQENDNLATEISMSKLAMRKQLDISEDKIDHLNSELTRQNKYLSELEEEKKLLSVQVSKLQELCRRELDTVETRANQKERISNQYKEICSKLSKRLEEQESLNKELKNKIAGCAKCSQFIEESRPDEEGNASSGSGSLLESLRKNSSEESEEIKQLETRIHDLEIELAQTKLELVESKCNNQALMHKLNLRS